MIFRPLWHDEVFTLWASRLSPAALVDVLSRDSGPPLFYLLERPFVALAEAARADFLARLLPFAATLLLFALAARLPRGSGRSWFIALAAASPLLFLYSAEARAYAPLALLDFAAFLLLFRGEPTARRMAAAALLCAAAAWTHYLALFFLFAAGLLLLATRRWRGAAAVAAGALFFLPWVPVLRSQPAGATAWMRESALQSIPDVVSALGGAARIPNPFGGPLPGALVFAATLAGAALLALTAFAARGDRETADALLVTVLTMALVIGASLVRPVAFPGRSELAVLPVWLWAAARAASRGGWPRRGAVAVLVAALLSSALLLARPRGEATPLRLAKTVAGLARTGDAVIAGTAFYLPARLAADRGALPARVFAFPEELASHPGWFIPRAPRSSDWDAVAAELREVAAGSRAYFLLHPFYASADLARLLAARGEAREILRRRDAVLIEWRPRT